MKNVHEKRILRLKRDQIYPRGQPMDPGFMVRRTPIMDATTPVGSIGSCFAGNLKNYLLRSGYNYVQTSSAPGSEIGSAAWGTVYNTACIAQECARANGAFHPVGQEWPDGNGGLLDPYRKGVGWKGPVAALQERERHAADARRAIERAEIFMITVGLTELWYSLEDGSVFFQVPPTHVFRHERHAFRASTVAENAANLHRALEHLWAINPACKVVLTVSPVPLRATFRPLNVVTANTQSKATLLAAVHEVVSAYDERVHYFPSYEIVTVMTPSPFKPDNRHPRPAVIERVMDVFVRSFVR